MSDVERNVLRWAPTGTMRLASIFSVLLVLFFSSRAALADPGARVVVVDVVGDIEDVDALRAAIGDELHATVIMPDDPRAASARGTLTIEARGADKRISATYRSLGTPVERTVDLPEDPKRARSVAVILAGNVAREEAGELLDGLKKPAAPTGPAAPKGAAAEDLRRLHAVLDELGKNELSRRKWHGIAWLLGGSVTLAVGALVEQKEPRDSSLGTVLVSEGAFSIGFGAGLLWRSGTSYDALTTELTKLEETTEPEDAIKRVESKWAATANEVRRARKIGGCVAVGVGVAAVGTALTLSMVVPERQQDESFTRLTLAMVAVGGLVTVLGVDALVGESEIEQSWHTYRATKPMAPTGARAPTAIRPKLGFAPVAGGGMASLGFTF